MKNRCFTLFLFMMVCLETFGQGSGNWIAFWNKDSTLVGFKDGKGKIKISPRFTGLTKVGRIDCITGLTQGAGIFRGCYITPNGRIVGRNNLYITDNSTDYENEGLIRFRDKKTHKVGMFNNRGDVVIPAIYNGLKPVRNGMIMALKGAHWDESKRTEENEFPWVGGKEILIDIHNKILVKHFPLNEELDFYSLLVSMNANKDPARESFRAVDGKYFSFINYDKEFRLWLKALLADSLAKQNLLNVSYKDICVWDTTRGWINKDKASFFEKNFALVKTRLAELNSPGCEYGVFREELNPYIYTSKAFEKYLNNIGASKYWMYPVENVVITQKNSKDISQDSFEFLRTENGYKLISLTIRDEAGKDILRK